MNNIIFRQMLSQYMAITINIFLEIKYLITRNGHNFISKPVEAYRIKRDIPELLFRTLIF